MIAEIIHRGTDVVLQLDTVAVALSSTVDGGLRGGIRYVVHHKVPYRWNGDPLEEIERAHAALGVPSDETITFLTAAQLPRVHGLGRAAVGEVAVVVSATVGLSNPYRISRGDVEVLRPEEPSTVNIATFVNVPLSVQAMLDVLALVSQAKALALWDLAGVHGTTSDAVAVLSPAGPSRRPYGGAATDIGRAVVRATYAALADALRRD
ncbi:adenosylcobinamide amidohydrolase [Thermoproteus tenax]|uniref:Adenosylcobinamide amidohydrolase n=1 Tax=Thermoproteus tenax (strain ATCC 35583 / DSM 2078 / JCM 9277 / NBRC 100435 / Kra 1) TaxID=768679 RepID=G4RKK0_THETK|nr:adenosylcobinamide amidohydrolase [Thermoproteus tenax]CCC82095.1 Adenosylcobinamide amidohydrolase [Thermoproteus tenax Kra 1]